MTKTRAGHDEITRAGHDGSTRAGHDEITGTGHDGVPGPAMTRVTPAPPEPFGGYSPTTGCSESCGIGLGS